MLAVGVDNMFILAHALERCPPRGVGSPPGSSHTLALPERLGAALAAAGPSVTLAAAAEALAFALGGLSGMPAVRNFSLCAALAVAIDYLLQARTPCMSIFLNTYNISAAARPDRHAGGSFRDPRVVWCGAAFQACWPCASSRSVPRRLARSTTGCRRMLSA